MLLMEHARDKCVTAAWELPRLPKIVLVVFVLWLFVPLIQVISINNNVPVFIRESHSILMQRCGAAV